MIPSAKSGSNQIGLVAADSSLPSRQLTGKVASVSANEYIDQPGTIPVVLLIDQVKE